MIIEHLSNISFESYEWPLGWLLEQTKKIYRKRAIINRGLYIFTPFFTAVYIVEQLVLQTIYVINKEIRQFSGLKSKVCNWERFQMKSGL